MFGPGGFGGPSAVQANQAAGLPHAGVPGNLAAKIDEVLEREPVHVAPSISFSPVDYDRRPFTLRSFLSPHRWALTGSFLLVVVETVSLQAGPMLTQLGIDHGVLDRDTGTLVAVAVAYVASVVVTAVSTGVRISYTGRLGERLMYELRVRIFSHLQRQSLDFFTEEKAGVLMSRMTSDIEALSALFQEGLVNVAVQVLTLAVITGVLFAYDPTLAAITLVAVVPLTLALTLWFRRRSDHGYGRVRDCIANVLSDLQESLAGVRVIAAHNRRRHNVVRHRNIVGDHRDANLDVGRATSLYAPGAEAIGVLGQAVLLAVGGTMVLDGRLAIGELAAFMLYLSAFFAPIQTLVQMYSNYQQGQAAVGKLRDLLSITPSVAERPDAIPLPPITGRVTLEHVTFGYDPDVPVLHDVDLEIRAGEVVAVVGPTGGGKSTIARLVSRFHDPQTGRVLVDGHDLRDVTLASLRRQLGVVPQEPFLFHGTVRDNLAFGDPEAGDDELLDALDAVGLADTVDRLGGLEGVIHERGVSLSAGERQLLALARAFLARPHVLLLDEATSNLDLHSERRVEAALDRVLEGRTAIIIAHRLATALRADRIAVVEDGRVIEFGPREQLVAREGHFAHMYATWLTHTAALPDPGSDSVAETSGTTSVGAP